MWPNDTPPTRATCDATWKVLREVSTVFQNLNSVDLYRMFVHELGRHGSPQREMERGRGGAESIGFCLVSLRLVPLSTTRGVVDWRLADAVAQQQFCFCWARVLLSQCIMNDDRGVCSPLKA